MRSNLVLAAIRATAATATPRSIWALDNTGLDQIAPDARGRSVIAFNTVSAAEVDLLIYGPVGDFFWGDGVTAASVVEQLANVSAQRINVRINSDGGVATDGLAIYNALRAHPATVDVTIDGVAASIASLIAQAGETRRVYRNATMMLHGPQSGVWGFADDLRDGAAMLDTIGAAMLAGYSDRADNPAEIGQFLADRRDHWFTAEQMVAAGLADEIVDPLPAAAPADAGTTAAALLSYVHAMASKPIRAAAKALRKQIQATISVPAFASLAEVHQRALIAHIEDSTMKQHCNAILAQAGTGTPAQGNIPEPKPAPATPEQIPAPAAPAVAAAGDPLAALAARNETIRGVFAAFADVPGVRDLESQCLADPRMTVEAAQARLLQRLPNGATPLAAAAPGGTFRVMRDETDTRRQRIADGILARAGILTGAEAMAARQDNPAAHQPLHVLAEQALIAAGVNTRSMDRDQISRMVLAQSTSDFTVILENVLNKMLLAAYRPAALTWTRFCATGTLADYRPHNRYHMGSFSDLKAVNEAGEYETGVLSDAAKEVITGSRKGRILQITPEVLVNDDLGAFSRPALALGQAAARAIEKDVYALLALNSGAGPTMNDGIALFHASHANIPTAAAISVDSIDAARQLMASQMDVGGNDYLDIVPSVWLGPLSLGGKAKEVNQAKYNDDSQKNQQKPNIVLGLFSDVVDTPRLTGTAWYMFADPAQEPVIEVAFLNGVQTPTIEQEINFRTDGVAWKVVHRYGVGAVGWRGAIRNAGA